MEQKQELRRYCLLLRRSFQPSEKAASDAALCAHTAIHAFFREADLLLCFWPIRGEADLRPLYEIAWKRGIPLALPRCRAGNMTFHRFESENSLVPDEYGIPAPAAETPSPDITERTLCLLPALAAGKDGTRLGYGGGYYDRYLRAFPGSTLLPIDSRFVFETLPHEPTDVPIQCILTEKGARYSTCLDGSRKNPPTAKSKAPSDIFH